MQARTALMHLYHFHSLLSPALSGWKMAGQGGFSSLGDGVVESRGGPGLWWYAEQIYENFELQIDWRVTIREDNSGVFFRCPPLDQDIEPAIERGYEIQIDERGFDPETNTEGSARHATGAIYRLSPVRAHASRSIGEWNAFHCIVRGAVIEVMLNGVLVSSLRDASREPRGHIALQAHHENSRVQFRELRVRRLPD